MHVGVRLENIISWFSLIYGIYFLSSRIHRLRGTLNGLYI